MCELLGMSANVPTDLCFSISGLMERGGRTGPHKDGWGVVFYEGRGIREFRDPNPGVTSPIAELVKSYPIKSDMVISHIRQANSGRVCLENTHPFHREMWGRHWTFAHNGQLKGVKQRPLTWHHPVGSTDSEHAFCWMMNQLRDRFDHSPRAKELWPILKAMVRDLGSLGVFNFLMSDSRYLYAYCSTKLTWTTRRAPFRTATLRDTEVQVDFEKQAQQGDVVTVIATEPLTCNEEWRVCQPGELLVFKAGDLVQAFDLRAKT